MGDQEKQRKRDAGREKLKSFSKKKQSTASSSRAKEKSSPVSADISYPTEAVSASPPDGMDEEGSSSATTHESPGWRVCQKDGCMMLLAQVRQLEDVWAEKEREIEILREELAVHRDFSVNASTGMLSFGMEADYRAHLEQFQKRLEEFAEAVNDRDNLITQLTEKVKSSNEARDAFQKKEEQLAEDVALLQKQLHHTKEIVEGHVWDTGIKPQDFLALQNQCLALEDTVAKNKSVINELNAALKEKDTALEGLSEALGGLNEELERKTQELCNHKTQSATEVQELMHQVEILNQKSNLSMRTDSHNISNERAQIEEEFGLQLIQIKEEFRKQLDEKAQSLLEAEGTIAAQKVQLDDTISAFKSEILSYKQQIEFFNAERRDSAGLIDRLTSELGSCSADLALQKDQNEKINEKLRELTASNDRLPSSIITLPPGQQEVYNYKNQLDNLTSQLQESMEKLQGESGGYPTEVQKLTLHLAEMQDKYLKEIGQLRQSYTKEMESLYQRNEALEQELDHISRHKEKCTAELNACKEAYIAQWGSRKQAQDVEIASLNEQISTLKKQLQETMHVQKVSEDSTGSVSKQEGPSETEDLNKGLNARHDSSTQMLLDEPKITIACEQAGSRESLVEVVTIPVDMALHDEQDVRGRGQGLNKADEKHSASSNISLLNQAFEVSVPSEKAEIKKLRQNLEDSKSTQALLQVELRKVCERLRDTINEKEGLSAKLAESSRKYSDEVASYEEKLRSINLEVDKLTKRHVETLTLFHEAQATNNSFEERVKLLEADIASHRAKMESNELKSIEDITKANEEHKQQENEFKQTIESLYSQYKSSIFLLNSCSNEMELWGYQIEQLNSLLSQVRNICLPAESTGDTSEHSYEQLLTNFQIEFLKLQNVVKGKGESFHFALSKLEGSTSRLLSPLQSPIMSEFVQKLNAQNEKSDESILHISNITDDFSELKQQLLAKEQLVETTIDSELAFRNRIKSLETDLHQLSESSSVMEENLQLTTVKLLAAVAMNEAKDELEIGLKNRIAELEETLHTVNDESMSIKLESDQVTEKIMKAKELLERMRKENHELTDLCKMYEHDTSHLREQLMFSEQRVQGLLAQVESLNGGNVEPSVVKEHATETLLSNQESSKQKANLDNLALQIRQFEKDQEDLIRRCNQYEEEVAHLRQQLVTSESSLESLRQEVSNNKSSHQIGFPVQYGVGTVSLEAADNISQHDVMAAGDSKAVHDQSIFGREFDVGYNFSGHVFNSTEYMDMAEFKANNTLQLIEHCSLLENIQSELTENIQELRAKVQEFELKEKLNQENLEQLHLKYKESEEKVVDLRKALQVAELQNGGSQSALENKIKHLESEYKILQAEQTKLNEELTNREIEYKERLKKILAKQEKGSVDSEVNISGEDSIFDLDSKTKEVIALTQQLRAKDSTERALKAQTHIMEELEASYVTQLKLCRDQVFRLQKELEESWQDHWQIEGELARVKKELVLAQLKNIQLESYQNRLKNTCLNESLESSKIAVLKHALHQTSLNESLLSKELTNFSTASDLDKWIPVVREKLRCLIEKNTELLAGGKDISQNWNERSEGEQSTFIKELTAYREQCASLNEILGSFDKLQEGLNKQRQELLNMTGRSAVDEDIEKENTSLQDAMLQIEVLQADLLKNENLRLTQIHQNKTLIAEVKKLEEKLIEKANVLLEQKLRLENELRKKDLSIRHWQLQCQTDQTLQSQPSTELVELAARLKGAVECQDVAGPCALDSKMAMLLLKRLICYEFSVSCKDLIKSRYETYKKEVTDIISQLEESSNVAGSHHAKVPEMLSSQEKLMSQSEELLTKMVAEHQDMLGSLEGALEDSLEKLHVHLKHVLQDAEVAATVLSLQQKVTGLEEEQQQMQEKHKSAQRRLEDLLAVSGMECGPCVYLRQELEAKHTKEMEELRQYFEKKCTELEKHYSDEVFSHHSRKMSSSSSCESELASDIYYTGAGGEQTHRINTLPHMCEPYAVEPNYKEMDEDYKRADEKYHEQLDIIKAKYSSEILSIKEGYDLKMEEMAQELAKNHSSEIRELENKHSHAVENLKVQFSAEAKKKEDNARNELEKIRRDLELVHCQQLEELKQSLAEQFRKDMEYFTERMLQDEANHISVLKQEMQERHEKEVELLKVMSEENVSEAEEDKRRLVRELQEKHAGELEEERKSFARQIDELTAVFKHGAVEEQEIFLKTQKEMMQEFLAKHQEELKNIKAQHEMDLKLAQAEVIKLQQELQECSNKMAQGKQEASNEIHCDILKTLRDHLQTLIANNVEDSAWPTELLQLKNVITVESHREVTALHREIERLKSELERCEPNKSAREVQISSDTTTTMSVDIKKLAATVKGIISEIAKYMAVCEEELNNTLVSQILKIDWDNVSINNTMDESSNPSLFRDAPEDSSLLPDISLLNNVNLSESLCRNDDKSAPFIPMSERSLALSEDDSYSVARKTPKRVHFAPDISTIFNMDESNLLEYMDQNKDLSTEFRSELDVCLNRLRKEAAALMGLSETVPKHSAALEDKLSALSQQLSSEVKAREDLLTQLSELKAVSNEQKELLKTLSSKLQEARMRVTELESREVITEGYGEQVTHSSLKEGLAQLQSQAPSVVHEGDTKSPHLALIEEVIREGDRMMEESKHEKEDLKLQVSFETSPTIAHVACCQQVAAAEKQLRSTRQFLEQQTVEREQERDEYLHEIEKLQEQLKAVDKDRSSNYHRAKEADSLEAQMKEVTGSLQEAEARKVELEAELKGAIEKVWVLRDIITELESQVEIKSRHEAALRKQVEELEIVLEQQSKTNQELMEKLESGNGALSEHVAYLEEQLHYHRQQMENLQPDSIQVQQMKMQLHELETTLDKKTKDLESLYTTTLSNTSCSSPSEDISFRDHLDVMRCATPEETPVSLPLDHLVRVQEKMNSHSRAEQAALKRIRDLEMQAKKLKSSEDELVTERDVLQNQVQEQLLQISSIKANLDEQRAKSDELVKKASFELEARAHLLEMEIRDLREALQNKEKQVMVSQGVLEETRQAVAAQMAEWSLRMNTERASGRCGETRTKRHPMQREEKRDPEKASGEAESDGSMGKYVPIPVLIDTMLATKNAELEALSAKIEELEDKLRAYSSLDLTDEQRAKLNNVLKEVQAAKKDLKAGAKEAARKGEKAGVEGVAGEGETAESSAAEAAAAKAAGPKAAAAKIAGPEAAAAEAAAAEAEGAEGPGTSVDSEGKPRSAGAAGAPTEVLYERKDKEAAEYSSGADSDMDESECKEQLLRKESLILALKHQLAAKDLEIAEKDAILSQALEKVDSVSDNVSENTDLRNRLKGMDGAQDELKRLREENDRLRSEGGGDDALRRQLEEMRNERDALQSKVNDSAGLEAAYNDMQRKDKNMDALIAERDMLRIRLDDYSNMDEEMERLKYRAKEAEVMRMERDRIKAKLDELSTIEAAYLDLLDRSKNLEVIAAERELYKAKYEELAGSEDKFGELEKELAQLRGADKERDFLVRQIMDMQCEIADQEDEIRRLVISVDHLAKHSQKQEGQMSQSLTDLQKELETKDKRIAELQAKMTECSALEEEIKSLRDQLKEAIEGVAQDKEDATSSVTKLKADLAERETKMAEREAALLEKQRQIEELQKNVSQKDMALKSLSFERESTVNAEDYDNLEKELERERQSTKQLKEELNLLQKENDELKAQLDVLHLTSDGSVPVAPKESLGELDRLKSEIANLKEQLSQAAADKDECEKIKIENDNLKAQLTSVGKVKSELESLKKEKSVTIDLSAQKEAEEEIAKLKAEIADLKAQLEAKGNELQDTVRDNLQAQLKPEKDTRENLLKLSHASLKDVIKASSQHLLELQSKIEELEKENAKLKQELAAKGEVTVDGAAEKAEIERLQGAIKGEVTVDDAADKAEIERLQGVIKKLEGDISDLTAKMGDKDVELQSARGSDTDEVKNLMMSLDAEKQRNKELQDELQKLKASSPGTADSAELENLRKKCANLEAQIAKHEEETKGLTDNYEKQIVGLTASFNERMKKLDAESAVKLKASFEKFKHSLTPEDHLANVKKIEAKCEQKLTDMAEEYEKRLKDMEAAHKAEMEQVKQKYNSNLDDLRSTYDRDVKTLSDRHTNSVFALQKMHEGEITDMNQNYETELQSMKNASADTIETLKKQHDAEMEKMRQDHENTLNDMKKRHQEEKDELTQKLEANRQDVEGDHKQEMSDMSDRFGKSLEQVKLEGEAQLQRLKNSNKAKIEMIKKQYEDLMEEERRKHEEQLKKMKPRDGRIKQSKTETHDFGEGEVDDLTGQVRKELERSADLDQNLLDRLDDMATRDVGLACSPSLMAILRKIMQNGMDGLTFDELSKLHQKTCAATSSMIMQNTSGRLPLEMVPASRSPDRPGTNNGRLCQRIMELEGEIKNRQDEARRNMCCLEAKIKNEEKRLQELHQVLYKEKQRNMDLNSKLGCKELELESQRNVLWAQNDYKEQKLQKYMRDLELESDKCKCLEEKLQRECNNKRQLQSLLESDRLRGRNANMRETDIVETMRIKLENALANETKLRRRNEKLETQLRQYQVPTSPCPGQCNTANRQYASDMQSQLDAKIDECGSLELALNREQLQVEQLQVQLEKERQQFQERLDIEREKREKLRKQISSLEVDKESLTAQLVAARENLCRHRLIAESLEQKLSAMEEVEARNKQRRDDYDERNRKLMERQKTIQFDLEQKVLDLQREVADLRDQIYAGGDRSKVVELRRQLSDSLQREQQLIRDLMSKQPEDIAVSIPLLQKLQAMNALLENHVEENASIVAAMTQVNLERQQLQEKVKLLEIKLLRQSRTRNIDNETEIVDGILAAERLTWAREKTGLENALLQAETRSSRVLTDNVSKDDQVRHLFGKYLRAESYRKALIWQKRYLLVVLSGYQEAELKTIKRLRKIAKESDSDGEHLSAMSSSHETVPTKHRAINKFKSCGMVVVAIQRMHFLVRRWRNSRRLGSLALFNRGSTESIPSSTQSSYFNGPRRKGSTSSCWSVPRSLSHADVPYLYPRESHGSHGVAHSLAPRENYCRASSSPVSDTMRERYNLHTSSPLREQQSLRRWQTDHSHQLARRCVSESSPIQFGDFVNRFDQLQETLSVSVSHLPHKEHKPPNK